jgi:hypothetical protein
MTRLLNLDKISKLTERTIRKEVGVLTTKQLITFANESGYEVTTPKDAYRVFGSIYNELIMENRDKKNEQRKAARKTERTRIAELKKNVTVFKNFGDEPLWKIHENLISRKGQCLVGVFIVNNKEEKTHELIVPVKGFNSWWKVKSREFWFNSEITYFEKKRIDNREAWKEDGSPDSWDYDDGTFYMYPETKAISTKFITQNFKDGVTNCMLTPIRKWATELLEGAKTKQTGSRSARHGSRRTTK